MSVYVFIYFLQELDEPSAKQNGIDSRTFLGPLMTARRRVIKGPEVSQGPSPLPSPPIKNKKTLKKLYKPIKHAIQKLYKKL